MPAKKEDMRIIAEAFVSKNPYILTHDCLSEFFPGVGMVRTALGEEYYAYVRNRLIKTDGSREFPEETKEFCKRLKTCTQRIRKPFGIVRTWCTTRKYGDPPAICREEVKKYLKQNPQIHEEIKRKQREYYHQWKLTEVGQLTLELARQINYLRTQIYKKRKWSQSLSQHTIEEFGNKTPLEIGENEKRWFITVM